MNLRKRNLGDVINDILDLQHDINTFVKRNELDGKSEDEFKNIESILSRLSDEMEEMRDEILNMLD